MGREEERESGGRERRPARHGTAGQSRDKEERGGGGQVLQRVMRKVAASLAPHARRPPTPGPPPPPPPPGLSDGDSQYVLGTIRQFVPNMGVDRLD